MQGTKVNDSFFGPSIKCKQSIKLQEKDYHFSLIIHNPPSTSVMGSHTQNHQILTGQFHLLQP